LEDKAMTIIRIGNKQVGTNQPCFIIAEAGVNHNGDFEMAKKLVDVAVKAGADAIKFQLLTAKGLYVEDAGKFKTEWGEEMDIFEVWKKTEIPDAWISKLVEYCKEKNIIFFSSVFEERAIDVLNPYVDAFKIGSSEVTHIPLLKKAAKTSKSMIFSVGGAKMSEVEEAVVSIKEEGNNNIAIMYCIAKYPTPLQHANTNAILTLKRRFPELVIGYSDHSMDPIKVPVAAILQGAKIFEKHFTLSRNLEGIDHTMSLEPIELKQMIRAIRDTEKKMQLGEEVSIDPKVFGDSRVRLTDEQKDLMSFVRRKIFVVKDIKEGEEFSEKNIRTLRPGNRESSNGLHPREYFNLIGKKATKDINALDLVREDHFI